MARKSELAHTHQVLAAGTAWITQCLVADGSILSPEALWTPEHIGEVRVAFTDNPDLSDKSFMEKLVSQMTPASPAAKRLTAEMIWALSLFPSNVRATTKRQQVEELWALSGSALPANSPMLSDEVLSGIGSGGPGFNNFKWRELNYLIALAGALKAGDIATRRRVFEDYVSFTEWMDTVPRDGNRQFRHMLRYFAFPDTVERISSNGDRRRILDAYGRGTERETKSWSDRQLDEALLALRRTLEAESPGATVDFYLGPWRGRWQVAETVTQADDEVTVAPTGRTVAEAVAPPATPLNVIYYGPPGTGKTRRLEQLFAKYTDRAESMDEEAWLRALMMEAGWRGVIAAALSEMGRPAKVGELREHRWVKAKAAERGRPLDKVTPTLWGYLQTHTSPEVSTVKFGTRREPFIFTKGSDARWSLIPGWQDLDEESVALTAQLTAGRSRTASDRARYRVVTFHPSYSYEDFVRGIKPVSVDDDATTQFKMVDGVFKRICDEARIDPGKRYALFIDEINRANIAKVFGELISLIEPSKRTRYDQEGRLVAGLAVQLPGSDIGDTPEPPFGVPANVDIYGTMNTADRSIALLDIALRRRFTFEEMEPLYALPDFAAPVDGIHLGSLLRRINDRLEFFLDRDHRIGHAYFIDVRTLGDLQRIFSCNIIPLLQEYFYDDLSRVADVLATTPSAPPFVRVEVLAANTVLGQVPGTNTHEDRMRYRLTAEDTWTAKSFQGLYAVGANASADGAS